nr:AIF_HP1_G0030730.mRNA.1.CDS.1 [Saccharomyces cerevisiae]
MSSFDGVKRAVSSQIFWLLLSFGKKHRLERYVDFGEPSTFPHGSVQNSGVVSRLLNMFHVYPSQGNQLTESMAMSSGGAGIIAPSTDSLTFRELMDLPPKQWFHHLSCGHTWLLTFLLMDLMFHCIVHF